MVSNSAHVMVITPHPDDAEFGVAGTVAHWVRDGKDVVYVVCTNGDKGSNDSRMDPGKLAKIREEEFLGYPDQALEDSPEFRKKLVRLIRTYKPYTVVTADPYKRYVWHRDHRIAGQVTLDAVFPYARDYLSYPDLIQEGLQPHKVKEILFWASEDPNFFSDITSTFDLKLAALRCHKSQVGQIPPEELENRLRERHRILARGKDFELAEAFHREEIWQ
ncbi:MAG: PIG-L family deacetylase [Deltaproteobacteria bacterium]|nr:PIG-L family deacetylase [Deltaproteobacteria bacterium]